MLVLAVIFAPAFRGREREPVPHVRYLTGPSFVQIRHAFATSKPFDDRLDLEELSLGILNIFRSGQRSFGTGAKILLEIANLRIAVMVVLQHDETARIVIDLMQRLIDLLDPFPDRLALQVKLRLKIGDFANRIFVEKLLEPRLEPRQAVGLEILVHFSVVWRR